MNDNWNHYRQRLFRLFLNPSSEVMRYVNNELSQYSYKQNQFGVQIRCAGNLADTKEGAAMVTNAILHTVPLRIRKL